MQININLTPEQEKALLTEYVSIQKYCQQIVENRANRIMEEIIKKFANDLEGVTVDEQAVITSSIAGKIIIDTEKLSNVIKAIIIRRAKVKSMIEKNLEQEIKFNK